MMKSLARYIYENTPIYYTSDIVYFLENNQYDKYASFEEFSDNVNCSQLDYCIIENVFYELLYTNNIKYDKYSTYQINIVENLNKSIELNNISIYKLLKHINTNINAVEIENEYKLKLLINFKFNINDPHFISALNFYNYYIVSNKNNEIVIAARKPKEITYNCDKVYHVTSLEKYNKIKKVGLCPKKASEYSPYRVYVFLDTNQVNDYIKSLISLKQQIDNKQYVVLTIDIKSLNESLPTKIKLYGDPSYNIKSAVFTLENIPSKYIELNNTIVESINISNDELLDDEWINNEKPVKTADGRQVIITKVDMSEVPNIIHGQVKMKEKLFDYEWLDDGTCQKAEDNMGNPKKPDEADKLIKDI